MIKNLETVFSRKIKFFFVLRIKELILTILKKLFRFSLKFIKKLTAISSKSV